MDNGKQVGNWEGTSKQRDAIEHLAELRRARHVAAWELAEAENDLLAMEVVVRKPVKLDDWPGHAQIRLRKFLERLTPQEAHALRPPR